MKNKIILLLIAGYIIVSCISCSNPNEESYRFTREPLYAEPSTSFTEMWNTSGIQLPILTGSRQGSASPFLIFNSKCIIIFGRQITDKYNSIQCLDTLTGKLNWQTELVGAIDTVTANDDFIFAIFHQGSVNQCKEQECLTILVQAYEIKTGNIVWSKTYNDLSGISRITTSDQFVNISGGGGHGAYKTSFSFIADTGERLEYQYQDQAQRLTPYDLYEDIPLPEWKPIVSNIAENNSIIFYLTNDAVLFAREKETYEVLGTVYFESDTPLLESPDNYSITVVDDIVIIYFGGSGQIFSFRFMRDG